MHPLQNHIPRLLHQVNAVSIEEVLANMVNQFPGQVTFSTSFSYEDQLVSHKILSNTFPISIFTLDTGRLFPETYSVWNSTNENYHTRVTAYFPDQSLLQNLVAEKGPNSFYESVENRKGCCYIRKVEPLKRALKGNSIWITGLRSEHSENRNDMSQVEWDPGNNIIKYHPIL
ncbi:MAG: phosphoadenosine phosphosulfate reductase family protein, partial [Ginsengibacter sp.]